MVSFDNTEVAFSGKSTKDLNRAYLLFNLIGSYTLVKIGKLATNIAIKMRLPVKGSIKATIFKQFCGGETIADCQKTIDDLSKYKIGTILDYSVEGKETERDFDAAVNEKLATIKVAKENPSIVFCVFKITGIARFSLLEKISSNIALTESEKEEFINVKNRMNTICKTSYESDVRILIDAEESWIQNAVDVLATEMMQQYNREKPIVYNTIQMYRWDRLAYIKQSYAQADNERYFLGLKLVRGAYLEKETARAKKMGYQSPIHKNKTNTDSDYDISLRFCIEHIDRIALCAGTHNEQSCLYLTELLGEYNIDASNRSVHFAQLLGMSDHISYNLANAGYNVVKSVPYGPVKEVLPYLIRRADENASMAGQTGRELSLIIKEKQRRNRTV